MRGASYTDVSLSTANRKFGDRHISFSHVGTTVREPIRPRVAAASSGRQLAYETPQLHARMDRLVKHRPIEAAVLDRLEEVRGFDLFRSGKVSDRARDLEDAIVGAGGE